MHGALHAVRKSAKTESMCDKQDERIETMRKFVAVDASMPSELFNLALYYLAIFIYMCRLPFSIVTNFHFVNFMWTLRPNFAKQLAPRTLRAQCFQMTCLTRFMRRQRRYLKKPYGVSQADLPWAWTGTKKVDTGTSRRSRSLNWGSVRLLERSSCAPRARQVRTFVKSLSNI